MSSAEEEQELTLIDHLIELRDRILKSVVAVVVLFLALFAFSNDIYTYVATPLLDALPEGSTMIAIDPTSPFFAPFKLTFYVAFLIAAPYILYQLWSFIAPGLYQNEKAVAIPLFISSVLLFYGGVAFARYVLFGFVFAFFVSCFDFNNIALLFSEVKFYEVWVGNFAKKANALRVLANLVGKIEFFG